MKKHAATLLILMLVALTGLGFAQTRTIKANVPFDFTVNGKTMPAGECRINIADDGQRVLLVGSGVEHAYVLPTPTRSRDASNETTLLFRQYGDRYFLAEINLEGSTGGYELPKGKLERELARNTSETAVTLLASIE